MENAITHRVMGAAGEYPVVIQPGALRESLPDFVRGQGFTRCAVITNHTLAPLYGEALAAQLPGGQVISVPDGEQYKTLDTLRTIYDALLAMGADRGTLIVTLGGGVIGDMGGFAAASFMRGVPLIQAPTSLLAMVDASIGGKVGVDLPQGKNLAGAFKDPLAVFADTDTLETLPPVEYRCGMAEVIKAALIDDRALFAALEAGQDVPVSELIARAAGVKVRIVGADRLEHGQRALLNLGHTFGHALEQVSAYAWKHGEAVGLGLVAAARLSERLGLCDPGWAARIEAAVRGAGLPVFYRGLDPAALWDAMRHDKKWRDGSVFILLQGDGQPFIKRGVERAPVIAVLEGLREGNA